MEIRIAKLEASVEHIEKSISNIQADMRDFRSEMHDMRKQMWNQFIILSGMIIAVAIGLAGVMAKGFKWL